MKQRIITGAILVVLAIPTVIFSGTYFLNILLSALSVASVYEMLGCLKSRSRKMLSVPSYFFGLVLPLVTLKDVKYAVFFALIYMFYMFTVPVFTNTLTDNRSTGEIFAAVLYIAVGFTSMVATRHTANGFYLFILIFAAAWVTDTAAYFSGRFFGKNKLCPVISPKKTLEGAIGGTVVNVLFFVLFGFLVNRFSDLGANYIALIVMGLVSALVSQMGDLVMSAIKRIYNIKDYGDLLPGHGGILDRFDSIIAVAPFVYILSASGLANIFTI